MTQPPPAATAGSTAVSTRPAPDGDSPIWPVLVASAVLAVAGVLGGLAWAQFTQPAEYLVTRDGAYLDEQGLGEVFNADGWFLVIGLVLGCLPGAALTYAFRRHGWVAVLAVLAGSCLASYLCYQIGHTLGPAALGPRLEAAAPGERVAVPLTIEASGVFLGWPIGAMLGAVLVAVAWNRHDPAAVVPVTSRRANRRTGEPA